MTKRHHLVADDEYTASVKAISSARRVLIYCGAGVSYPLVGLTWNSLVLEVARHLKEDLLTLSELKDESKYLALVDYIEENSHSPLGNATLISAYINKLEEEKSKNGGYAFNADKALKYAIGKSIYRRAPGTRHQDSLLQLHIKSLVISLLRKGVEVRIVTTNYDTHLEKAIRRLLELANDGDFNHHLAVLDNISSRKFSNKLNGLEPSDIPFAYLHGRIPSGDITEAPCGRIIFSEPDYHSQESTTEGILNAISRGIDCTVILGSSLEDPPLVNWLQNNRCKSHETTGTIVLQSITQEPYSLPAMSDEIRYSQANAKKARFASLGVDYYLPLRSYADISVFLRDTTLDIEAEPDPESPYITYGDLKSWATGLKLDEENALSLHRMLRGFNRDIVRHLSKLIPPDFAIATRTEYWLRAVSPHCGDPLYMAKIADSSAAFLSDEDRRCESLIRRFPGRTAALRAVQLDSFELTTLGSLGHQNSASRWQAFYGAPIYNGLGNSGLAVPVTVGAIVIAIRLEEGDHDFISVSERNRFAEHVGDLIRRIRTGSLSEEEISAQKRLKAAMDLISIKAGGHLYQKNSSG